LQTSAFSDAEGNTIDYFVSQQPRVITTDKYAVTEVAVKMLHQNRLHLRMLTVYCQNFFNYPPKADTNYYVERK